MADIHYGATLTDFLAAAVARFPQRPATYFAGQTLTYSELDAQVAAAAGALREMGVRPGDRVAILLPNCPQHVVVFFAILRLGAVVVEHNPRYTAHELTPLLAHHGARVAIAWEDIAPTVSAQVETTISVSLSAPLPLNGPPVEAHPATLADAALILYTSGTTARPKGVVLTHGNLAANCLQLETQAPLRAGHERFRPRCPCFIPMV